MPLKNCGVQVIPGMKSYQTRFKKGGKKMSKYEFKRKLKPDNAVGMPGIHGFRDVGERLMVQPCFFVGNLMMPATPGYSSW